MSRKRGGFIRSNRFRYTIKLDIPFKKRYRHFSVRRCAKACCRPFAQPINAQKNVNSTVVFRDWSNEAELDFFI